MRGGDSQGAWDQHEHTALFEMENQQGPTVSSGNSAQCYIAAWMGGEIGGEWLQVYVRPSLFAVYLKLSHC